MQAVFSPEPGRAGAPEMLKVLFSVYTILSGTVAGTPVSTDFT
jgi:hypothetical protein